MTHQQVAFDLLQGIEDYTHENEQRGAAIELSELRVDTKQTDDSRQDGNNSQEERAGAVLTCRS